jgi:hypothetical protein
MDSMDNKRKCEKCGKVDLFTNMIRKVSVKTVSRNGSYGYSMSAFYYCKPCLANTYDNNHHDIPEPRNKTVIGMRIKTI